MLKELVDKVNLSEYISIRNVSIQDESCFIDLQKSTEDKIKAYCCVTITTKEISDEKIKEIENLSDILLKQKTPLRVLHRRTSMIRDKTIHRLKIRKVNAYTYVVFVLSSAGTYIKEFIHSDLNRTNPSFGDLIDDSCDIYQLDVLNLYEKYDKESVDNFNKLVDECDPESPL